MCGIRESVAHVRTQRDKLEEVASVQRHFHDAPVFNDRSDRRVLRRDERGCTLDLDRLADISNLEREVKTRRLLDLQLNVVLRNRSEAGQFDFDVVSARLQRGEIIDTRLITNCGAHKVCGRIRHRDGDAGNDRARRIMYNSADAGLRLGHRRHNTQENHKPDGPETPTVHSSSFDLPIVPLSYGVGYKASKDSCISPEGGISGGKSGVRTMTLCRRKMISDD